MEEIWKDVPRFEGIYKASNLGRVKSLKCNRERILKGGIDKDGYIRMSLWKGKDMKNYAVHRIILMSFTHESDLQVNHIDGVRNNNRLDNLEWCTLQENGKKKTYYSISKEDRQHVNMIKACTNFNRFLDVRHSRYTEEQLSKLKNCLDELIKESKEIIGE